MKLGTSLAISLLLLSCSSDTKPASESTDKKTQVLPEQTEPEQTEPEQTEPEQTEPEQVLPEGTRWVLSTQPDGVKAFAVAPDSFAAKAGIEAGDVVQSIDGTSIRTLEQLAAAVASKPTTSFEIKVVRDNKEVSLQTKP